MLYFNAAWLNHPAVRQTIVDHRGPDTFSKLTNLNKINLAHTAWYSRKGTNLLPFKNELTDIPGFAMPDYNPDYNRSWTEITDQRCQELRASHWHKPWVVLWSGGIDSTVIVAAMIKNLTRADLDNITIACTSVSIWENPQFYFDYIKPNFKVVNSTELLSKDFDSLNFYIFHGDPGDQLFGSIGGTHNLLYQNPELLHTNIINNKDCAIDYIANLPTNKKFAEWYYHVLVANADSAGVPATTLYDLMWWSGFNNAWTSVKFIAIDSTCGNWKNTKNAKSYIDKSVHWYDSNDYQQWAMNSNNIGEKLGSIPSEYKLAAKKYIYSIDNNRHYFKFKTKAPSYDIYPGATRRPWCCVDDNWNLLNLKDHQDQIISMLPDHLV
jgi:hypothetical protein